MQRNKLTRTSFTIFIIPCFFFFAVCRSLSTIYSKPICVLRSEKFSSFSPNTVVRYTLGWDVVEWWFIFNVLVQDCCIIFKSKTYLFLMAEVEMRNVGSSATPLQFPSIGFFFNRFLKPTQLSAIIQVFV